MSAPTDAELDRSSDDERLANALLARRPGAVSAAWTRFQPLVMRILRRGGSAGDIADLNQEVFLCFFCGVHRLRDPRALRPFVVTLATRTLTNELRRRQRRRRLQAASAVGISLIGEHADAFSRHAALRLGDLIGRMKERERRVLVLCQVERRRVEEAADLLGVSVPTARRALSRARRRLMLLSQSDPFLCEFAGLKSPRGSATALPLHTQHAGG